MAGPSSNDNSVPPEPVDQPGAHGQAAMLLVESLIHSLIAKSVISVADAIEIVDVAANVSGEMEGEPGRATPSSNRATALLRAISKSLSADLPRVDPDSSEQA